MSTQMATSSGPMAVLCVAVVIGLCVFIVNPITFTAILKTPSLRRNHSNFFLLNLGLVDMLLMVCIITFKMYMLQAEEQTQEVCAASIVVHCTISMAAMLSSFAIAVDRFLFIHKALTYSKIVTSPRTVVVIVSIWALSLVNGLIPLFGGIKQTDACIHPANMSLNFQGIFIVTLFLATGVISTGLYGKLFFIIRRHNQFLEQHAMAHSRTHDCARQACTIASQLGECHLRHNSHVSSFCSKSTRNDILDTDHTTPCCDELDADHTPPCCNMLDADHTTSFSDLLNISVSEAKSADIISEKLIETESNVSFSLFPVQTSSTNLNKDLKENMKSKGSRNQDMVSQISSHQDMGSQISSHQQCINSQISSHQQGIGNQISSHQQGIGRQISSHQRGIGRKISSRQDTDSRISSHNDIDRQISSVKNIVSRLSFHQNADSSKSLNDEIQTFSSTKNSSNHAKISTSGRVFPFRTNSRHILGRKATNKPQAKRKKKVCFLKCQHLRNLRTIKTLMFMFAVYFICWTPIMCCKFVFHIFMKEIDDKWLTVAWIAGASNSLWNFAVFPLRKVELRRVIIKLLSRCVRCPW